jgi:HSP20 family molecular chaperone IbpA
MIKEEVMANREAKYRVWINPCDCGCSDPDSELYTLSYELPGVKKEDIDLKITKEGLQLLAKRNEVEYYNEFAFACDAKVDDVEAIYEDGLLSIQVPLSCPSPFKDAKQIPVK